MALVSVVIPVYYNAPSLPTLARRLNALSSKEAKYEFEFIYVDDGSGDDSFAVLSQLAEQDTRVRVIKLARNFGSTTAIMAGISHASGDCVGFITADLQEPPEMLSEMLRRWEDGYKVVLAVRNDRREDPWSSRVLSALFNQLFKKLVFKGFSPQGVGFYLIDRQVADILVRCSEKNTFLPGLILWTGFQPSLVEYDRAEREHGKSRWTLGKKLTYLIDAFAAFSYLPLRLCSLFGLLLAGLGGLYALVVIVYRLLNKIPVPGWSGLMVVVLLTSGAQLVMLGVIGEYLWRALEASRRRPLFTVDTYIHASSNLSAHHETTNDLDATPDGVGVSLQPVLTKDSKREATLQALKR